MKENYKNIIKTKCYESPCGILLLGAFHDKLCLCDWQVENHRDHVDKRLKRVLQADFEYGTAAIIEKAIVQLDEFFAGERKDFDVPLLFVGTDFQKKVWKELLKIPFGDTIFSTDSLKWLIAIGAWLQFLLHSLTASMTLCKSSSYKKRDMVRCV